MTTWATLTTNVLRSLDDPTATFHTTVREYLDEAQMLLALARVTSEKTVTFPLDGQIVYPIHATLPDCLTILRVSFAGKHLAADHLATLSLLDAEWQSKRGEPESWYVIGGTHVGFHPVPDTGSVAITYLANPSTTGASPVLQENWHVALEAYARGVALGKESQFTRAVDILKQIAETAGIRDVRFLATDRQTKEPAVTEAQVKPED